MLPMGTTGTGFETIDENLIWLDGQLGCARRAIRPRRPLHPERSVEDLEFCNENSHQSMPVYARIEWHPVVNYDLGFAHFNKVHR